MLEKSGHKAQIQSPGAGQTRNRADSPRAVLRLRYMSTALTSNKVRFFCMASRMSFGTYFNTHYWKSVDRVASQYPLARTPCAGCLGEQGRADERDMAQPPTTIQQRDWVLNTPQSSQPLRMRGMSAISNDLSQHLLMLCRVM